MVESSDSNKSTKSAVCETCGKSAGAAVSGSGEAWSFKPVCRCSITGSDRPERADLPVEREEKTEKDSTTSKAEQNLDSKEEADVDPERSENADPKVDSNQKPAPDVSEVPNESGPDSDAKDDDSGGWASITSAKTANGPDFSKKPRSESGSGSGSWRNAPAPKSFSGKSTLSGDSHESWISIGGSDFAGPPADDFNRPVAHEIGKLSSSGATSSSASSSGTNLGVSYSSGTNLSGSGSSGALARGNASKKTVEEQVDWVPVKKKPPESSKSQFADDTELLDLTHKTETAEEKIKPTTRKSIQEAFRRNRIKTMVIAVIAVVLAYGVYSYASSKGLIKKFGILNQSSKSDQQSKKGSVRQSKKNKRAK